MPYSTDTASDRPKQSGRAETGMQLYGRKLKMVQRRVLSNQIQSVAKEQGPIPCMPLPAGPNGFALRFRCLEYLCARGLRRTAAQLITDRARSYAVTVIRTSKLSLPTTSFPIPVIAT